MNRRHSWKWLATAASLAVGLALIASACGSSSNKSAGSGGTTATSTTTSGGKTFPNFRIAMDTGIDYLDPGLSYTVEGWAIMWNVYLPLIGYKHVERPGRRDDRAVPREGSAEGLGRRQDVQPRSEEGPEVLGRHADQGE